MVRHSRKDLGTLWQEESVSSNNRQVFASVSTSSCPCCGSDKTAAQEAAEAKAQQLDTSNMSAEEIEEANAFIAKKHRVDAVRRGNACDRTGRISATNCPYGCQFCKQKPSRGTEVINHKADCRLRAQGEQVAAARAAREQAGAGLGNQPTFKKMILQRNTQPSNMRRLPEMPRCPSSNSRGSTSAPRQAALRQTGSKSAGFRRGSTAKEAVEEEDSSTDAEEAAESANQADE